MVGGMNSPWGEWRSVVVDVVELWCKADNRWSCSVWRPIGELLGKYFFWGRNCHFGKSRGQIVNSGFLGRVIGSGSGYTGRVPGYPGCPVTAGRDQALLGDSRRRCSDQCRVGIWSSTWCATKHPKLPTTIPASFLHQSRRGLFLSARNQEGYNCPKSISRKRTRKCTDFEEGGSRRWSGGCDGVGRFSGVVRPCSWSGCGRGVILSTMVCLVGSETASIAGIGAAAVAVAGGGSRPFSGELSRVPNQGLMLNDPRDVHDNLDGLIKGTLKAS
ncbi:hypothetical protein LXL04_006588 [Taraxacum kok-saghyz]